MMHVFNLMQACDIAVSRTHSGFFFFSPAQFSFQEHGVFEVFLAF